MKNSLNYFILYFILLSALNSCGIINPYIGAHKKIEKGLYDKAYFQLSKIKRDSIPSVLEAFVKTEHFKKSASPFQNLDSAIKWAHLGEIIWQGELNWKKRYIIKQLNSSEPFNELIYEIDSLGFKLAKINASEQSMLHYLENFPDSRFTNHAISWRDSLAFLDAKRENTYLSYKNFIEKYPNSRQAEEAREVYEFLLYETHTRDGHVASFENFIEKFPHSPYISDAQNELFDLYTLDGRIESFEYFLEKFPQSIKSDEANLWISHLSVNYEEVEPILLFPLKESSQRVLINPNDSINTFYLDSIKNHPSCEPYRQEYFIYGLNSKWGLGNYQGQGLIPAIFHDLEKIRNDIYIFSNGQKKGLAHVSGFRISDAMFDEIGVLNDTFISVERNGKQALAAYNGKVITDFKFDSVKTVANGILALSYSGKWAAQKSSDFLDFPEGPDLTFEYDSIKSISGNRHIAYSQGLSNIYRNNKKLNFFPLEVFELVPNGFITGRSPNLFLLDNNLDTVSSNFSDYFRNEHGSAYKYDSAWECYFYNDTLKADSFAFFNDYYVRIYRNDSLFILNSKALLNNNQFDKINTILYQVNQVDTFCFSFVSDGNMGLLSAAADTILLPEWEDLKIFDDYSIRVKSKGKFGLYNFEKKNLLKTEYDAISNYDKGGLSIFKNGKFGFIIPENSILIKPKYSNSLRLLNKGPVLFTISKGGNLSLLNSEGKSIFEAREFQKVNDSLYFFNINFQWQLFHINRDYELEEMDIKCQWYSVFKDGLNNNHIIYKTETGIGFYDVELDDNLYPEYYELKPILDSKGALQYFIAFKFFEEINLFLVKLLNREGDELHRVLIDSQKASGLGCDLIIEDI